VRVARLVARGIGWVFVAVIAYHAGLAVAEGVRAARDGNWPHAAELIAIAAVGTAIVVAALIGAARATTRAR
jgi:hypothetical protein